MIDLCIENLSIKLVTHFQLSFAYQPLSLSCEVSGLKTVRRETVDDLKKLSELVDFINLVSWDLAGHWTKSTGFGNAVKNSNEGFNLVSLSMVF